MFDSTSFTRVLIEKPPISFSQDYCCHAYSLQVHTDANILRYHREIFVDLKTDSGIQSWQGFPYLSSKKNFLSQVNNESDIRDNDIVLYFNDHNYLLHSGRVKEGRVVSKWGGRSINPLTGEDLIGDGVWMHHWEDIPAAYKGSRPLARILRIIDGITADDLAEGLMEFRSYLHEKGVFG